MALTNCPECGHEVSTAAIDCPNCGRPLARTVTRHDVPGAVVTAVPREREGFPAWAFIPIGIIAVLLVVVFFVMMNRNSELADNGVNINVSAKRTADNRGADSRSAGRTDSQVVSVPPSAETQTVTVPPASSSQMTTTTVPAAGGGSTKGLVELNAKIVSGSGAPQPVKNEKFYLLDKDLEEILDSAGLEAIDGQTLTNSFGMSVLYPDRYGEFNRSALAAINRHIKYSTLTDGSGKAQMKEIEPDSYYLFGVTRTGKGFSVWSSPVTVREGQNLLNLSPQRLMENES